MEPRMLYKINLINMLLEQARQNEIKASDMRKEIIAEIGTVILCAGINMYELKAWMDNHKEA